MVMENCVPVVGQEVGSKRSRLDANPCSTVYSVCHATRIYLYYATRIYFASRDSEMQMHC